jgi:hypothetical protein
MSKILQCVDYGIYPQQHLFSLSNPTKHPADMSNLFSFAIFGQKSTSLLLACEQSSNFYSYTTNTYVPLPNVKLPF